MNLPSFARSQRLTIVAGILCFVLVLVVLQLWLLTATMESFLGGGDAIVVPAALASTACFALNFSLLHFFLRKLER